MLIPIKIICGQLVTEFKPKYEEKNTFVGTSWISDPQPWFVKAPLALEILLDF